MRTVWHLPFAHGSFAANLADGERALGLNSTLVAPANPFARSPTHTLRSEIIRSPRDVVERFSLLVRARREADIIHFNYGATLMDPMLARFVLPDVAFYGSAHKVMTFQGSDIRIAYPNIIAESREMERSLGHVLSDTTSEGHIPETEVIRKKRLIARAERHMDRLFALNPDLLVSLPKGSRFLPYPAPPSVSSPISQAFDGTRQLRVLHLATNRVLKGTGLIERALRDAAQHLPISVDIRTRVPHAEAMAAINACDVLIDQVALGWYGGQAVEALQRGKPVVCRLQARHRELYLPSGEIGIVNTDHNGLATVLAKLIDSPETYQDISRAGKVFVTTFHDPQRVADLVYEGWLVK